MLNNDAAKIVTASGIAVCLMTSTFCCTRIFFKFRSQRTQVHSSPAEQENQTISINILRYRQTVSTSLKLEIAVMFCFFSRICCWLHSRITNWNWRKYPILFHGNFIVFKICLKSNFVLREDQRGKKSSDGDIALSSNVKEFSCFLVLTATAMW